MDELRSVLTQHSLSQSSQLHVGILEGLLQLLVHGLLFALQQNGRAAIQDPFGGSLHHQQVAVVIGVLRLVHGELERMNNQASFG